MEFRHEGVFTCIFLVVSEGLNNCFPSFLQPPRCCDDYWSEFRHCKSLWNRFHYYYAHGTSPSCQHWKQDYNTCREWEKTKSTDAKEALQNSERNRVAEKKKFTPVWDLRKDPPKDWHRPLHQGHPHEDS
ncbi:synaptic plasticity regulator PANTS [Aplochiton taeniatus]